MVKIIAGGLIGLSTGLLIALPPTTAASICKVTDPTGTPLNVREKPNGRVVNAVKNGREVKILESDSDQQGRSWAKVGGYYNGEYKVWGWVLREFISCYERH